MDLTQAVLTLAQKAKAASRKLMNLSSAEKDKA